MGANEEGTCNSSLFVLQRQKKYLRDQITKMFEWQCKTDIPKKKGSVIGKIDTTTSIHQL